MRIKSVSVLLFIFLGTNNLSAQSTTANLEGWILDSNNNPVATANIIVSSSDLQGSRGISTDERGYFRITSIPIGIYSIKISHISYQKVTINNINLYLGQTTSLGEIHLQQSTIETSEVIVSAGKPLIDTRSTTNGKSLSAKQFEQLPIERNYFHVAELLPNANLSYKKDVGTNFAGGTGIENKYFIDGSEVTAPAFGVASPALGILGFDLPYNFVRQVEIYTGGYQAEYQSTLGGIVNTVTYSGGNEFHGSIFGFITNNNFSSAPRLTSGQPPQGNYSNYDIGFGIGGPIIKDRLWYYAAYDPDIASEDVYVTGLGNQNSRITKHKFAGKLTWSLNENNLFTLSICGNPYSGRQVLTYSGGLEVLNPEYCNLDLTYLFYNAIIKGIHSLNDNFMLESSLSIGLMKGKVNSIGPKGSDPWVDDYVTGISSGGQGFSQSNPVQNLFSSSIKGTLILNNHIFKTGIEFAQNSTTRDDKSQGLIHYPSVWYSWDMLTMGTVKQNDFSAFIQDSWQIFKRLSINFGVRWDPQWLIASDGTIAQKITNQWQPRIGIIYQPSKIGTQKITASFGRFYQPLQLNLSISYHIKGAFLNRGIYPNDPRIDTSGARYIPNLTPFVTNIPGMEGQYFDEYSLGYERLISTEFKYGVRGIYRKLGQGVEDGVVSEQDQEKYGSLQVYGNPGSGILSMLPEMKREYISLELSFERFSSSGFNFFISYILSRNWGNYDGLAETNDITGGSLIAPNATDQFGISERMINAEGLLPNDRTHVLKFFGSYVFDFGLTTGILFQWMSGTPLNEFGKDSTFKASTFLQTRGTVGRTPSIWDLNFRFMYDFSKLVEVGSSARLILDVLHFASQRKALDYDQYHYYDYEQNYANPNYMVPVQFQPPMSVRLGMEVDF